MGSEESDDKKSRDYYEKKAAGCPDPLVSKFRPDSNFGAVTEAVDRLIDDYMGGKEADQRFNSEEFKVSVNGTRVLTFYCIDFLMQCFVCPL